MAGLDPAIHLLRKMDTRGKPAYDGVWLTPIFHASIASLMRFRVSGKSRRRFPVASAIAFAIEAAAGPWPVSPAPRKGWPGRLMIWTSTRSGTALKRRIG